MSRRLYHDYDDDRYYSKGYGRNFAENRLAPLIFVGVLIVLILGIVKAFKYFFP
jgi:hypothetical protein